MFWRANNMLRNFANDDRGAILIMFALLLMILVGAVGAAVDYSRWLSARTVTQNAADAAVLAGGRVMQLPDSTPAQVLAAAKKSYEENAVGGLSADKVSFSISPDGASVIATAAASAWETIFLGVVGIESFGMDVSSEAILNANSNSGSHVEVSLMLDVTGSMAGTKLTDLKAAAKDLIDIVVWPDQSVFKSRVAVAPFADYVNVGATFFTEVTGHAPGGVGNEQTCVKERDTSHRYSDHWPNPGHRFDYYDLSASCNPVATVVPLTSDVGLLKSEIDGLVANGSTAGHLGTAWTWYLLSPDWDKIWPSESEPYAYSMLSETNSAGQPLLRKIAVLMTDGSYNAEYSGDDATTQAKTICTNMKAEGITVYTVGFDIAVGSTPDETMKDCATSVSHYYNASSGEELKQAFRDIAMKIATLRLAN